MDTVFLQTCLVDRDKRKNNKWFSIGTYIWIHVIWIIYAVFSSYIFMNLVRTGMLLHLYREKDMFFTTETSKQSKDCVIQSPLRRFPNNGPSELDRKRNKFALQQCIIILKNSQITLASCAPGYKVSIQRTEKGLTLY